MAGRLFLLFLAVVFACSFVFLNAPDACAEGEMKLILPAALTEIKDAAFESSAAEYVVLPDGCVSIGSRAFADCENLEYIEIPDSVVHIAWDAFEDSNKLCILCTPNSTAAFLAGISDIPWKNINAADDKPVSAIKLSTQSLSLTEGETKYLEAQVLPEDASNTMLNWSSSDETVATVSEGMVYAAAPGLAVITAAAADESGVSANCIVQVESIKKAVSFADVNVDASSSNAYLYAKATAAASGKFTSMGLRVWNSGGELLADYAKALSTSARTSQVVWFDVYDDSGVKLDAKTDYICQMYVVFEGKTSWSDFISIHTGEPNAADTNIGINTMVANLQNSGNTSVLPSSKKLAMVTMADELLNEGYDPAFVAGVLANIYYEGSFGKFESSKYSSGEPAYLVYMDENYDYRNKYSNKLIYNGISLSELAAMLKELDAAGYPGKFGLGSVQWTGGRTKKLVDLYIKEAAGSDTITLDQVVAAEVKMIKNELAGSYKYIHTRWDTAYEAERGSDDAAFSAGYRFCVSYEVPASYRSKAITRGRKAMDVYKIMLGI